MTGPPTSSPLPLGREEAEAVERRILQSRGSITPLYRALLDSPPVADGWERLLTAIRRQTLLEPRLRELIILRIAILNRADYEFQAHVPHARDAGLTDDEIAAVRAAETAAFTGLDRLVLDYADAMTRDIRVPDQVAEAIKAQFDARARVELTATIAAYNMVSRFLVALDVH